MAQTEAEIQRQKEMQQAEELLFSGRQELGFAKGLFLGNFVADWVMPYPRLDSARQAELETALADVREMLDRDLDPDWIDRNADIPRHLIDGLGRTGVLGMTAPRDVGGRGFSQMQNCRILEEIGRRDASTSVFVNAHHSIGIRALVLFGSREQQAQWLPALVAGEKLAAFALTEREAGSDAANVRMTARMAPLTFSMGKNVTSPMRPSRRSGRLWHARPSRASRGKMRSQRFWSRLTCRVWK
jgi:acyl-CoA dehydrogenase family member 9